MTLNQKKLKREERSKLLGQDPWWTVFITILVILVAISIFITTFYRTHFWPKTTLNGVDISNLSLTEAVRATQDITAPNFSLIISYLPPSDQLVAVKTYFEENSQSTTRTNENETLQISSTSSARISQASSSAELKANYDAQSSLKEALKQQEAWTGAKIIHQFLFGKKEEIKIRAKINLDEEKLANFLEQFSQKVQIDPETASVELTKSGQAGSLVFTQGKDGRQLDFKKTQAKIQTTLNDLMLSGSYELEAEVVIDKQKLTKTEEEKWLGQAEKLVGRKIDWKTEAIDNFSYMLSDRELVEMLKVRGESIDDELLLSKISELAAKTDRAPVDPVFEYNAETLVVTKFSPPETGLELDKTRTYEQAKEALTCLLEPQKNLSLVDHKENSKAEEVLIVKNEAGSEGGQESGEENLSAKKECRVNFELAMTETEPDTPLSATNNLGINEEIGFGESYYYHSIAGRVVNVALASSRLNLALIAPGKEFSFNQQIGDVSAASGYQNGYIIQGGRSVLAPGGGVCQVSSTLFRALLDSGVKITLRLPHAYRVSYYELSNDPGFDATVYSGNIDLRFVNDTPGYILIYAETDTTNSYMSVRMYGTNDGRSAEIVNYQTYGASRAPATEYIEDPSLPRGTTKQIDFAIGGMKVEYTNIIKDASGNIIRKDDYFSNYQPWSAKFLVGTG